LFRTHNLYLRQLMSLNILYSQAETIKRKNKLSIYRVKVLVTDDVIPSFNY